MIVKWKSTIFCGKEKFKLANYTLEAILCFWIYRERN